jgi:RNA-directed DNA polymerase
MNPPLRLSDILESVAIRAAWDRVRSNRGAAGEDSVTIDDLESCFEQYWPTVERAIRSGQYQPAPLRPVAIPKPSGGMRNLAIPSVVDRIVQQSLAAALSARWEPVFPACSFAYRPGTGAAQALDAVMVAAGPLSEPVALRFDIKDFFDTVPHSLCAGALADTPCDPDLTRLAMAAVAAPLASPLGPRMRRSGIPQGSPLSPVMANIVMLPFDLKMVALTSKFVRYADDMIVLCGSVRVANEGLTLAGAQLAELGLRLNQAKTVILPLHEASFLGCGFQLVRGTWVRKLPTATLETCREHLRDLAGSGHSPLRLRQFLRQWAAYFLPAPEDQFRHREFLNAIQAEFGMPEFGAPEVDPRFSNRRSSVPPRGFQYDGGFAAQRHAWSKSAWAGRFFLRRIRFGLTFRRKGFIPVPSGLRVNVMGHHFHFRF